MLRSKRIDDYLEAKLADFKPGAQVPVDVHLYFSSNRHILIWRKTGEVFSKGFLKKYRARGMEQVWIHRDDLSVWQNYLKAEAAAAAAAEAAGVPYSSEEPAAPVVATPPLEPSAPSSNFVFAAPEEPVPVEEIAPPPPAPRTEEGENITKILGYAEIPERQRTALVARAARQLIAETVQPADPAATLEAMGHARKAVRDILDAVLETSAREVRETIDELWDLSSLEPGMDHAINVATFSVLFAMAFGRITQELLADIALSALLHDVGLTQVPLQIARTPWNELDGRDLQHYSRHVDEGLRLLDELAPGLSPRVRPLIQQHHEKFDGTGYPLQLQKSQIGDIAQLIGMADAIESMASGQWDGRKGSLLETFERLEEIEKAEEAPQHFNPEVFTAVLRWIRGPRVLSSQVKAADVVRASTRELMRRARS